MTDIPPPFPLTPDEGSTEPVTITSDDEMVTVTAENGRISHVVVHPRAPRESLGPTIADTVNAALDRARSDEIIANARAMVEQSASLVAQGEAYNEQTFTYLDMMRRDLASAIDEAADHVARQPRE